MYIVLKLSVCKLMERGSKVINPDDFDMSLLRDDEYLDPCICGSYHIATKGKHFRHRASHVPLDLVEGKTPPRGGYIESAEVRQRKQRKPLWWGRLFPNDDNDED